ncbi:MAG: type II toxin-antitoxin system mRNA interferase toxin, RelE/StbE family [Rhodospirillaceae bacterium]|nr:MAG: type II toxin-antitoxin system mRNA interferase toxin, RelE/StbE family [Rhodospirillaceae bacterium]
MRDLFTTTLFKKDLKRIKKRGKDPAKIKHIIDKLLANEPLDKKFKAHRLIGNMAPYRECHIEPDWLLIWDEDNHSIRLMRTGSHSDLFP